MSKQSAGLLMFRITPGGVVEVLIVHPGGPFWAKKDLGAWSIPKGEYAEGEDPAVVADREFGEELGSAPPIGSRLDLGELKQPSGKRVHVWAVEGHLDVTTVKSNTFEMEWPRGSGQIATFPEVDRAAWVTVARAGQKLLSGQVGFLERLIDSLRDASRDVGVPGRIPGSTAT